MALYPLILPCALNQGQSLNVTTVQLLNQGNVTWTQCFFQKICLYSNFLSCPRNVLSSLCLPRVRMQAKVMHYLESVLWPSYSLIWKISSHHLFCVCLMTLTQLKNVGQWFQSKCSAQAHGVSPHDQSRGTHISGWKTMGRMSSSQAVISRDAQQPTC